MMASVFHALGIVLSDGLGFMVSPLGDNWLWGLLALRALIIYVLTHGIYITWTRRRWGIWYKASLIAYAALLSSYVDLLIVGTPWYLSDFVDSHLAFMRDTAFLVLLISHLRGVYWGHQKELRSPREVSEAEEAG